MELPFFYFISEESSKGFPQFSELDKIGEEKIPEL